jgi:hypothetical protein
MKKKLLSYIVGLALIGLAFLNINFNNQESNLEYDLLSLNQEALAGCEINGEIPGDYYIHFYSECYWYCWSGGYFECPI